MNTNHTNNPISPQHPLLELLLRVGLRFVGYFETTKHSWVEDEMEDNPIRAISRVRIIVNKQGFWTYGSSACGNRLRQRRITTEQELTDYLADTELGVLLFQYKLNLLNQSLLA